MLCKVTYSQVPEIRRWETLEAGGRGSFFSPSQPSSPDTHHSLSRNLWWPSVVYNQSLILTARMDGAFTMRLVCPQHLSFFSQELESSRAALATCPPCLHPTVSCVLCPARLNHLAPSSTPWVLLLPDLLCWSLCVDRSSLRFKTHLLHF